MNNNTRNEHDTTTNNDTEVTQRLECPGRERPRRENRPTCLRPLHYDYTIRYDTILHYTMLCYTILYYTILYYTIL